MLESLGLWPLFITGSIHDGSQKELEVLHGVHFPIVSPMSFIIGYILSVIVGAWREDCQIVE